MEIRWLDGTSSFVAVDLPDAPLIAGLGRVAPKVLTDGAELLARSATYALACLGLQGSGISVGINAPAAERDAAVQAWCAAMPGAVPGAPLALDPGRGLDPADLAPLRAQDPRPAALWEEHDGAPLGDQVTVEGVLAAMQVLLDDLSGRRIAIEEHGAVSELLAARVAALGAEVVATAGGPDALEELGQAPVDALLLGSRAGVLDHDRAETLAARAIVPTGPVPVTTRALAVLRRREVAVLPDFVTTAGVLSTLTADLAAAAPDALRAHAAATVGAITADVLHHEEGPLLGACERAEAFLSTWRDELPFGRPLA